MSEKHMRNKNIDALKGFGIFLVVVGHICTEMQGLVHWIYSFHMPLFFMISGFLDEGKNGDLRIKDYILKKMNSLLYPYIPFSFIFLLGSVASLLPSGKWELLRKHFICVY